MGPKADIFQSLPAIAHYSTFPLMLSQHSPYPSIHAVKFRQLIGIYSTIERAESCIWSPLLGVTIYSRGRTSRESVLKPPIFPLSRSNSSTGYGRNRIFRSLSSAEAACIAVFRRPSSTGLHVAQYSPINLVLERHVLHTRLQFTTYCHTLIGKVSR